MMDCHKTIAIIFNLFILLSFQENIQCNKKIRCNKKNAAVLFCYQLYYEKRAIDLDEKLAYLLITTVYYRKLNFFKNLQQVILIAGMNIAIQLFGYCIICIKRTMIYKENR
jgi:hypothetical protein